MLDGEVVPNGARAVTYEVVGLGKSPSWNEVVEKIVESFLSGRLGLPKLLQESRQIPSRPPEDANLMARPCLLQRVRIS